MLWCRDRGRYRIHDRVDFVEHGVTCLVNGTETPRSNGDDDAEADAVQVSPFRRSRKVNSQWFINRYQGHIGAALVLGGVDTTGPHLFTIHPHGSTDKLPYVTMGSGSLAAMAVFESGWKANMEVESHLISPYFTVDSLDSVRKH